MVSSKTLNSLNSLNSLRKSRRLLTLTTYRVARPNFSGEVVRCGASQKKPPRDSTQSTALGGLNFWDVPQIAAYCEKLISCQKGLDLFYRKRRSPRDSTEVQPVGSYFWDGTKVCPLSQEIHKKFTFIVRRLQIQRSAKIPTMGCT